MASGSRPRPSAGACQRYRPAARTMPSSLGFPSRTDTRAHAVYPKDQPVNFDALAPAVLCRIVRSADQLGGGTRAESGEAGAGSAGVLHRLGRPRSGGVLRRREGGAWVGGGGGRWAGRGGGGGGRRGAG